MEFRLLGPLEVVDRGHVVDVGGGRRRALLTLLLMNANEVVSADRLIDELWGERPLATAGKSVQVYVSQLRKALRAANGRSNGEVLLTRGNGYILRVGPEDLDTRRFEDSLADAQRLLADGDPRGAAEELRAALALWRGPALYDFTYEPFAQREATRLEQLRLVALETRIDAELALGEHARAVGELESLVKEHSLRERFRAQLMLALYRCGRQSEALSVYREGRKLLHDELGLEPTPELRELERKILTQNSDLAAPAVEPARSSAAPSAPPAVPGARKAAQRAVTRRAWFRGPVLIVAGGLLLAGAAALALVERLDEGSPTTTPGLGSATNSVVGLDASKRRPNLAVPLPGRPTDLAAADGTVWIATVDSAAVTSVEAKRGSISRTVPLRTTPDAIAVGEGSVWVADGGRGILARLEPGYDTVVQTISYPRARSSGPAGGGTVRPPRSSLAVGGGGVWITNGSTRLLRVDPRTGRMVAIRAGRRLSGVAVSAGVVWALSPRTASVVRVDPRDNAVTDTLPIVARPGLEAPSPVSIAATANSVWVLNANTATVTRIDPATRGVITTIPVGADRVPTEIAAAGDTAWVANGDGTLSRIDVGSHAARSIWIGGSLDRVATDGPRVWATTTALDQKLPGGTR